ncbi:DUF4258 domain-containing protein [Candidatus Pacearchaeota archaeon]|nr:DUF4258 domain-containing protein [Candidatus Pacearchaeota archaeon]
MRIIFTEHSKERMEKYDINIEMIKNCLNLPDSKSKTYMNRMIYQKKLNGYFLRVIVEESKEIKRIITVYKARRKRYGI